MMNKRLWLLRMCFLLLLGLSGCSVDSLLKYYTEDCRVDDEDLSSLALELSEELLERNIDSIAVMDFTGPFDRVSEFEQRITERFFLSLSGFSGKLWVVGGEYLQNALEDQDSPEKVLPVMGIQAVISGTITPEENYVSLKLEVTEAHTARSIHSLQRECRLVENRDELANFATTEEIRSRNAQQSSYDIPAFPWPPPEASASMKIPSNFLHDAGAQSSLAQVANRLENAFAETGYIERSYYSVPGGFALVSRMEQFCPDGSPKPLPDRWSVEMTPPKVFSLGSYMEALFRPQEGLFRVIGFVVTSAPFSKLSEEQISQEEALEWLSSGMQTLPSSLGDIAYSEKHYCVALVYEFEQSSRDHAPKFTRLSRLPGFEHLKQARLWDSLER